MLNTISNVQIAVLLVVVRVTVIVNFSKHSENHKLQLGRGVTTRSLPSLLQLEVEARPARGTESVQGEVGSSGTCLPHFVCACVYMGPECDQCLRSEGC